MFGVGLLKGLGVTLKEFLKTYIDDLGRIPSRYAGGREVLDQTENLAEQTGLFTVQYPEERRKLSERFRYIPMLLYEPDTGDVRCTACGICAKVCPVQCIWIVRDRDQAGKPITRPAEYHIDASLCMNCGLCAEFCPFDAIKMNHDFEVTAYKRMPDLVLSLDELRVPTTYYAQLRPTDWVEEEVARAAKGEKKAGDKASQSKPAAGGAPASAGSAGKLSPEELERRRADALASRAATGGEKPGAAPAGGQAQASAPAPGPGESEQPSGQVGESGQSQPNVVTAADATPAKPAAGKMSPEELERRRAEALARHKARKASEEQDSG